MEIEKVVKDCKTANIKDNVINNSGFFKCSAEGLPKIKETGKYSYLN